MNNYNKVLEAQQVAFNSTGLAAQRYEIYLQGIEASTNRFKDAWDKVWMDTINSDAVKTVYDMGTAILTLVSNLGGLIPVLTGVGIAMAYIKKQAIALVVIDIANWFKALGIGLSVFKTFQWVAIAEGAGGVKAFMLALQGYSVTLLAAVPPIAAVVAAITALIGVFLEYKAVVVDVQKSSEKATSSMFGDLFKNSKDNSSSGIADTYVKAIERMNDAYREGGILAKMFVNQQALINEGLSRTVEELNKSKGSYADYFAGIMKVMTASGYQLDSTGRFYREIINNNSRVKIYAEGIQVLTQEQFYATNAIQGTTKALSDQAVALEEATKAQNEYNAQSKAIVDANTLISELISSYKEFGQLSLEQINTMRDMFPEDYTKAIYLENGAIKLNVEELKKLLLAKAELAVKTAFDLVVKDMDANATIEQTDATREHTKALQEQLDIASAQYDAIKNGNFFTAQSAKDAQKALEDQKKAYDDLLKDVLDMIKDRTNAEKDALQKELQAFKDAMDAKKQALQDTADAQKQALQDELDGYKSIIDAQKRLIDLKKAEADQADAVATKNKEISDIDAQLLALQFDNSQEANAQRLKLENDRAIKVKELSTMQNDYSVNNQKDALDQEYALFEKENKAKQSTIDKTLKAQLSAIDKEYKAFEININNKIAELDAYLNQSGTMTQDAINLLKTQSASFFVELINWNKAFGTSVDTDVTDKWKTAFGEMGKYIDAFLFARGIGAFDIGNYYQGSGGAGDGSYYDPSTHTVITPHHSGGFVGDKPVLKNDEEFAKLVKGELVVTSNTMGNFMKNILPNLVGGAVGTIGNISMNFVVQGSLDKSVIPELKDTIIQAVNNVLKDRGVRRNAFSYSV